MILDLYLRNKNTRCEHDRKQSKAIAVDSLSSLDDNAEFNMLFQMKLICVKLQNDKERLFDDVSNDQWIRYMLKSSHEFTSNEIDEIWEVAKQSENELSLKLFLSFAWVILSSTVTFFFSYSFIFIITLTLDILVLVICISFINNSTDFSWLSRSHHRSSSLIDDEWAACTDVLSKSKTRIFAHAISYLLLSRSSK